MEVGHCVLESNISVGSRRVRRVADVDEFEPAPPPIEPAENGLVGEAHLYGRYAEPYQQRQPRKQESGVASAEAGWQARWRTMHFPSYKTLVRASSIGSAKAAERTVLLRCCANRGRALGPWKAQHAASKCSIMRRDEDSRVFSPDCRVICHASTPSRGLQKQPSAAVNYIF
jgi:hypothetical protein